MSEWPMAHHFRPDRVSGELASRRRDHALRDRTNHVLHTGSPQPVDSKRAQEQYPRPLYSREPAHPDGTTMISAYDIQFTITSGGAHCLRDRLMVTTARGGRGSSG